METKPVIAIPVDEVNDNDLEVYLNNNKELCLDTKLNDIYIRLVIYKCGVFSNTFNFNIYTKRNNGLLRLTFNKKFNNIKDLQKMFDNFKKDYTITVDTYGYYTVELLTNYNMRENIKKRLT
jgi:hypothetical protein